jgi:hypothetical protein
VPKYASSPLIASPIFSIIISGAREDDEDDDDDDDATNASEPSVAHAPKTAARITE